MDFVVHLLNLVRALASDRARLALENVALKQQLLVLKRTAKRPRINDGDRTFWLLMRRMLADWKDALHIVKPETVVRWHRQGFRYYWRWKSRAKPGRPPIPQKLIWLIKRLSRENPLWGAPHIEKELALLGHEVAESTVAKYMVRTPRTPRDTWRAFIQRHMDVTAACDFFVVPTLTFKRLYCFVVLSHDRRRILHVNVTENPSAEWTGHQVIEAFPGDQPLPRFLIHDQDGIYGEAFQRKVRALRIQPVRTGRKKPQMNAYVERVIGTIRRECTDHVIAMGERHLVRVLREYVAYYNDYRPHTANAGNSPVPRSVDRGDGEIIGTPVLGGLHHTYRRAA